ncbi:MAG: hypothetical protein KM310_03855 [Clostridiales bacterium]|nr:hypothetical protein [Clostridiales bacterium]
MKLARLWLLVLVSASLILSACGGTSKPAAEGESVQEAVVALPTDIVQLDPLDIGDAPSSTVAAQIMEALVQRDENGNIQGALAESWETSPDGRVWTFHLRQGVKFHDGSDFNAEVVKWHFDRILSDPDAPQRFRKQWSDIIEKVETPDDYTVVVTLKSPNAAFLDLVILTNAGMIWSKANFEKLGAKEAALHPVGTGPFIFESWEPGQKVVLKRNPDYWGGAPKLETLIFRPIAESNTQVIELETGGIHIATKLGLEDVQRLQNDPNVEVLTTPAYQVRFFTLNLKRPLMQDPAVRQALNYAFDRTSTIQTLVGSMGVPSESSVLPVASWAHPEKGSLPSYGYDPEKAKEVLLAAGYELKDGRLYRDGQPVEILFITPNGRYFGDREIAEVAKKAWEKVGFTVTLKVMEWAPYLEEVQAGNYDVAVLGWNQSSPEPSIFFDPLVKTGGRANYSGYSDPELDEWLTQGVQTTDMAERKALYEKAAQRVEENAWFVPLYNEMKVAGVRKEVKGYIHTPAFTRYNTIYIGK